MIFSFQKPEVHARIEPQICCSMHRAEPIGNHCSGTGDVQLNYPIILKPELISSTISITPPWHPWGMLVSAFSFVPVIFMSIIIMTMHSIILGVVRMMPVRPVALQTCHHELVIVVWSLCIVARFVLPYSFSEFGELLSNIWLVVEVNRVIAVAYRREPCSSTSTFQTQGSMEQRGTSE